MELRPCKRKVLEKHFLPSIKSDYLRLYAEPESGLLAPKDVRDFHAGAAFVGALSFRKPLKIITFRLKLSPPSQ